MVSIPQIAPAARLVVQRLALSPGDAVTGVRLFDDAVLVLTTAGRFEALPHAPPGGELPGALVLDLRALPRPPGGGGPRGAAVVAGPAGPQVLDLGAPAGVSALLARVPRACSADVIADLVSRYGRPGPHNVLVGGPEDLPGAFDPEDAERLGLAPPVSRATPEGHREVTFFTYFVRGEPPDGVPHLGVDRWTATISPEGAVAWTVEERARRLESPRYRPGVDGR